MVKSHKKKCQHYFRVTTITTNDMVKLFLTDSKIFPRCCLVLMRFLLEGMLCSEYQGTLFTPKESEIGRYLNSDRIAEGSTPPLSRIK